LKISFTTALGDVNLNNGFGNAGYNVSSALVRLGHEVPFRSLDAPVEVAFSHPKYDFWTSPDWDQYRIQYTPWESSVLPDGWMEGFQRCDEVWTPSPLIARWFAEAGVKKDIKVYQHGLDPVWLQARRERKRENKPVTFLHHGEPAPRKGGQMALDAFRAAFGKNNSDVHLVFKSFGHTTVRARIWIPEDNEYFILGAPEDHFGNVSVIRSSKWSTEELIALYKSVDAMVYPGWGEGFGLIPLQALGAGLPTICTEAWAPYSNFLQPELRLDSELVDTPWPRMHPGKMFKPNFDDLVEKYRYVYDNYDDVAQDAAVVSSKVEEFYDWDRLTQEAFAPIVQKFS
jgi:glycosyltransferase involved in cell wall biosynthesis